MRKSLPVILTWWLAFPGGIAVLPQAQKSDAPATLKTRSELVLVPVTVKDERGNLVGGLEPADFRVFEDGAEQQIALFSSDPFPLSAVILIDNDLSLKPAAQVQKSLESIAAGFAASDEVAIVLYDEYPATVLDFTADNDQVFSKLKKVQLGSSFPGEDTGPMTSGPLINGKSTAPQVRTGVGKSAVTKNLDDAVYACAKMLRNRGRDRRKIIFLISDGSNSHHNQRNFEETRELLLSADVSVYAISVGNAFLKHESSRLLKYANDTGGDAIYASKQRDLERLYSSLTEEARTQYTLAFVPGKSDPGSDYHAIEVRVERPRLRILARQGFYTSAPH